MIITLSTATRFTQFFTRIAPPFTLYCCKLNWFLPHWSQSIDDDSLTRINRPIINSDYLRPFWSSQYFARPGSRSNFLRNPSSRSLQALSQTSESDSLLPPSASSSSERRGGGAVRPLETIVSFLPIVLAHSSPLFLSAGEMALRQSCLGIGTRRADDGRYSRHVERGPGPQAIQHTGSQGGDKPHGEEMNTIPEPPIVCLSALVGCGQEVAFFSLFFFLSPSPPPPFFFFLLY